MHWDGYEGWIPHNQVHLIEKEVYSKTTASTPQISTDSDQLHYRRKRFDVSDNLGE